MINIQVQKKVLIITYPQEVQKGASKVASSNLCAAIPANMLIEKEKEYLAMVLATNASTAVKTKPLTFVAKIIKILQKDFKLVIIYQNYQVSTFIGS